MWRTRTKSRVSVSPENGQLGILTGCPSDARKSEIRGFGFGCSTAPGNLPVFRGPTAFPVVSSCPDNSGSGRPSSQTEHFQSFFVTVHHSQLNGQKWPEK
jgi:hypothetical protein